MWDSCDKQHGPNWDMSTDTLGPALDSRRVPSGASPPGRPPPRGSPHVSVALRVDLPSASEGPALPTPGAHASGPGAGGRIPRCEPPHLCPLAGQHGEHVAVSPELVSVQNVGTWGGCRKPGPARAPSWQPATLHHRGTELRPRAGDPPRGTQLVRSVPRPRRGSPFAPRERPARPGGHGLLPAQCHHPCWPCPGSRGSGGGPRPQPSDGVVSGSKHSCWDRLRPGLPRRLGGRAQGLGVLCRAPPCRGL